MLTRFARFHLATLVLVGPLTAAAGAQCFNPDGFDGPCCTPVTPTLPTFPGFNMQAQGICWDDCNLAAQSCLDVTLTAPLPTTVCGQYSAQLSVLDCSGSPLLSGTATLDYGRRWNETSLPGVVSHEVFRFLIKVDLAGDFLSTPVCPVPPCVGATPAYPETFWYGYVDFALDCPSLQWENALVLYHGCDDFQHGPFSATPGLFHDTETYAIVGPDTSGNPFLPFPTLPLVPPSGTVVADGTRDVSIPGTCLADDYLVSGNLQQPVSVCFCPLTIGPPQHTIGLFNGSGVCGTSFNTINLYPLTPWLYMITTGIGAWTTTASYPGPEEAYTAEGLFFFNDPCTGTGAVQTYADVYYGGMTQGGYTVIPDPAVLVTQEFVDLASNYSLALPSPPVFPLMGKVMQTDHVISGNML